MQTTSRLLIAAAVAIPAGMLSLAGWLNHKQIRDEAFRNAAHTAEALSEHALRTFRAHELIIDFVDSHVQGWTWGQITGSEPLHRLLARMGSTSKDVSSIFLLGPSGRAWVSSRRHPMPPIDGTDREYYVELRERDTLHISRLHRGRLDNDRFFSVARRRSGSANGGGDVRGETSRFDGLIGVSVNPAYFESFYGSLLAPSEVASLVRADGAVLVRHPSVDAAIPVLPPSSGFMQAIRKQPAEGVYTARSLSDGLDRVIAYRQVGDYPVYASFQLSLETVWAQWRRAMIPYALAGLLTLGVLLFAASLAQQRAYRVIAEQRQRDAEEASDAKDRFVAALSHELRNPLSAISVSAELLRRRPGGDAASHAAIDVIGRQINQVRRILDDLLDTARAIYGKLTLEKRRVDLHALAREVIGDRRRLPLGEASIALDGDPAWTEADPVRLRQMVENLLENALRYGGRNIRLATGTEDGWARLAVEDDGQGISADLLPRLFEPFVQAEQPLDRARGGLGLGLALVDRLAKLHGGSVAASSEGVGRGSRFTIRMPRAEPPARPAEPPVSLASGGGRRVLVVDDSEDARESLRALLALDGHDVATAADGREGRRLLREWRPDAALLDIGLPGLDGYELARQARAQGSSAMLVAVTGYGQARDREKALAAGFDAHLTKPFSYDDLARLLQRDNVISGGKRAAPW